MQKNIFFLVVMFASSLSHATNFGNTDFYYGGSSDIDVEEVRKKIVRRNKDLQDTLKAIASVEDAGLQNFITAVMEQFSFQKNGKINTREELILFLKQHIVTLPSSSRPSSPNRCTTPLVFPCGG